MRQDRIPGRAPETVHVEDVYVDLARPVAEGPGAPERLLDRLRGPEQANGGVLPADRGDGVVEGPLPAVTDGIGPVDGGDAE